ncbi:hypothetical protein QTO34_002744 [Cnephaeus nilssonii]|uniref:F-box domain-containing protein n=1 Tax=Cnephaeus nilssonii TaxID=3371016 RepID=A0AA40HSW7_CNENI|nr:hypothetical protein QTO34_002744 [Eptesicus nilssonii]
MVKQHRSRSLSAISRCERRLLAPIAPEGFSTSPLLLRGDWGSSHHSPPLMALSNWDQNQVLAAGVSSGSSTSCGSPSIQSQVIFRWWKISLRSGYQSTKPGEVKESHEDFLENSHLQIQIALVFGARILDYVFNLCEGRIDFLERLSDNLLMVIISYLDIEDIASLSLTSHRFSKLCTSDKLWEPIVEATREITPAMKALAQDQGLETDVLHQKVAAPQEDAKSRKPGRQSMIGTLRHGCVFLLCPNLFCFLSLKTRRHCWFKESSEKHKILLTDAANPTLQGLA